MKLLLILLAKLFNSLPKTDFILVHWCHIYDRYGLESPNLVGMNSAPTVSSTDPATNIATTTATASGNITATGGENATTRGVCYVAGTGTPTLSDTVNSENGSFGTGAFSRNLTGLSPGTLYTFRAFATNSVGTGFGSNVQFTTLNPPVLAQSEAAFYEDGTEADSTVIDTGADSITRDVTSDSNILLRTRIQNSGGAGLSTDDYQLKYSLNEGSYADVKPSGLTAPVEIGNAADTNGDNNLVVTLTQPASVGDIIVVRCASGTSTTQNTSFQLASVADSRSNTYAVDVIENRTDRYFAAIATGRVTTALQVGDTVTLTFGTDVAEQVAQILKVSGAASTGWVDKTATRQTLSTEADIGPTATLASAPQMVIASWGVAELLSATDFTVNSSGWDTFTEYESGGVGSTTNRSLYGAWKIVDVTDAVTIEADFSSSEQYAGVMLTLKQETEPPPVVSFNSSSLTDGNATTNRLGSGATVADSYSESNADEGAIAGNFIGTVYLTGQSFTGNGSTLDSVKFYLKHGSGGATSGNAVVKIYAHSGTFGTDGVPTGSALATSNNFDASVIGASFALHSFVFSGAEQIVLTEGTRYFAVIEFSGAWFSPGVDNSSSTASGNRAQKQGAGAWTAFANDLSFYVYTGIFVPGKISEDGLVDNHQITASNFTEYLYSLTLVSAELEDADTLDFRVLRNGAVLNTYTVTPRITVSKGGADEAEVVSVNAGFTIPAVTATFASIAVAIVASVSALLSIPAVTATYAQESTASVAPIASEFTVNDVTATPVFSADVSPVESVFTVQAVNATHQSIASVQAVDSTFTVQSVTAEYVQIEEANIAAVISSLTVQSVTASHQNIASVDPVEAEFTIQSVTGIGSQEESAQVASIESSFTVQEVSATHQSIAQVSPVLSEFSVEQVTADYQQINIAEVDALSALFTVNDVTASTTLTAQVQPIVSEFTVNTATATHQSIANVASVSSLFTIQQVTAAHSQVEIGIVAPVQAEFIVQDTTALSTLTADVTSVNSEFTVNAVSATYQSTASVNSISSIFTINAVSATHQNIAQVAPVSSVFTIQSVSAQSDQAAVAIVDAVGSVYIVSQVSSTYIQVETATVNAVISEFNVNTVSASHQNVASVVSLSGLFTIQDVTASHRSQANVNAMEAEFTVQSVTAQSDQASTAVVSFVESNFTVQTVTSTYQQVVTASVNAIDSIFGVSTATASMGEVADVSAVEAVFNIPPVSVGVKGINVFLSGVWVEKPAKVWTGSAWETKPVYRYDGINWV